MELLIEEEAELKDLGNYQLIHIVKRDKAYLGENTKGVAKGPFDKISQPSQQKPGAIVENNGRMQKRSHLCMPCPALPDVVSSTSHTLVTCSLAAPSAALAVSGVVQSMAVAPPKNKSANSGSILVVLSLLACTV